MSVPSRYDSIGHGYASTRREDPRLRALITGTMVFRTTLAKAALSSEQEVALEWWTQSLRVAWIALAVTPPMKTHAPPPVVDRAVSGPRGRAVA